MTFEIIGPDNKRKAYTESEKCIPDAKILHIMKESGYTFRKDGKRWVPGKEKA